MVLKTSRRFIRRGTASRPHWHCQLSRFKVRVSLRPVVTGHHWQRGRLGPAWQLGSLVAFHAVHAVHWPSSQPQASSLIRPSQAPAGQLLPVTVPVASGPEWPGASGGWPTGRASPATGSASGSHTGSVALAAAVAASPHQAATGTLALAVSARRESESDSESLALRLSVMSLSQ